MFKKNLLTLVQICKTNNITPILCTEAHCFDKLPYSWFLKNKNVEMAQLGNQGEWYMAHFSRMLNNFNQIIIEVAKEQNCTLIDIDKELQDLRFFRDEVHFNDIGSMRVAEIIAEKL